MVAFRLALMICVFTGFASAIMAEERRDFYRNLPPILGPENRTDSALFALDCDTAYVRKGDTTLVRPGAWIYFAHPSINSMIKVEGTLILQGNDSQNVLLSGSVISENGMQKPGLKMWGGIEVAEGGTLIVEHTSFFRAPTPITTFSDQIRIKKCYFEGSSGIILSDGSILAMESKGQFFDKLARF